MPTRYTKYRLKKSRRSLLDIASEQAEPDNISKFYRDLKKANPGVTRLHRGQTLNIPARGRSAKGRGRIKLSKPVRATLPPAQTGSTEYAPPEFEGLPPVQDARKYGPQRRAEMLERQRVVPPVQEDYTDYRLPREQYEYFYGENPQRLAEERNRQRRAEFERRRDRERAARTTPAAIQSAEQQQLTRNLADRISPNVETEREDRRFRRSQYGAQYDRPSQQLTATQKIESYNAGTLELSQSELSDAYTAAAYELEAQQGYESLYYGPDTGPGELKRAKKQPGAVSRTPTREVSDNLAITPQVQTPYTTDWLDAWLDNNQIDLNDPDSLAQLNDATQYMLAVVGAIEPVDFAADYGSGGYGGYGGYGGGWYGGGGGGGGGYSSGGYGRYPEQSGNRRYAESLGLVSWRI